jgi:Ca2+-binding EF-hand superfamily protein
MDMNYAIREENILRAFQVFDKDGSGSLTIAELVEVMGSEEHARELVGELDLNGDGVIRYEIIQLVTVCV